MLLQSAKKLAGKEIVALDGQVGRVRDLLINSSVWTMQYIVARRSYWPIKFELLIPRNVIKELANDRINVSVCRHDLRPLRADTERKLKTRTYGVISNLGSTVTPEIRGSGSSPFTVTQARSDPDLGSMRTLLRCHLKAEDRKAGRIRDLIINPATWIVVCVVVNTRGRLPGKKVLMPVPWIEGIDLGQRRIYTNLRRKIIQNAPAYNANDSLSVEQADDLFVYYSNHEQNTRK